jgi:hypothetical protein
MREVGLILLSAAGGTLIVSISRWGLALDDFAAYTFAGLWGFGLGVLYALAYRRRRMK